MQTKSVVLTESDKALLKSHINVAKTIAQFLGDQSEVILHSLENIDESVIYIANGHHTGRSAGAPMTDYGLKMLKSFYETGNVNPNSYFVEDQGKLVKSITSILTNPNNQAIGMLCINLYVSAPFPEIIKIFMPDATSAVEKETFFTSSTETIESQLSMAIEEVDDDADINLKQRNKAIVAKLYERGVFEFKEATSIVSEHLNITRHAVYKYLREFKKVKTVKEMS